MPLPPTFQTRIVAGRMLSPQVRELTLERDGRFSFEAGQWVSLALPAGAEELKRSYSVASAPDSSARFQVAVTRVEGGPGSTWLHAATAGTELAVTGPQGFFTRPLDKTGPSLFVGTGTGLTPLRSMIHHAIAAGDARPLWLVFGARTAADLIYRTELEELSTRHPNLRIDVTLSRPDDAWAGLTGYVQTHVATRWRELERLGGTPHAYICGLHRMVGSVRDLLRKDLGVPREQVHSERYD